MKKALQILFLLGFLVTPTYALEVKVVPTDSVNGKTVEENVASPALTRRDIFTFLLELPSSIVRSSFQYIDLKFTDVKKDSKDYGLLQKMVYLNFLENKPGKVLLDTKVNAFSFYAFVEKSAGTNILSRYERTLNTLKKRYANQFDVEKARRALTQTDIGDTSSLADPIDRADIAGKMAIFDDVYNAIANSHYDQDTLDHKAMIYSAIEGLAKGTGDKHTVYFPPIKSQSFEDSLSGEFEGIGAYVDMKEAGVVYIISPIPGSPAERAGFKAGDIIVKVGEHIVTEKNSLQEVVSWIKGPAGSTVEIQVKRGDETLTISVVREKITIKEVEYEMKGGDTYYIKIKTFGDKVSEEFTKALGIIKNNSGVKKIIFDLRNNPGGYLDQVNDMLGNFVPEGQNVSIIKYRDDVIENKSIGLKSINLNDYKIVILQNGGTASASEIFIGTLKDYFPKATIIGEKSYGKGSVQTIRGYNDGSILKFTIAKWFTGKTSTGIDGIGIKPDVDIPFDDAQFKELEKDNQLEKALSI